MALADTVRMRHPVDVSMFEVNNLKATLDRHTAKPSIHLAIPSIQQYNLTRTILGHPEDILRSIFEHAVEEDALYTAFSSFSQPRPDLAPLSVRSTSRQCAQYADAEPCLWSSLSGVQHSPNSPHPSLIRLWIKRAGPTRPLSFHIAPREHYAYWEDEMTPTILRIFLQHAPRWKDIAFDLDDVLAPIYLDRLTSRVKPKPQQVENLELLASRITDMEVARRLFGTVETYAETVSKFLWGCPKGFTPPATITLPHVKVLGLDVESLDDACRAGFTFGQTRASPSPLRFASYLGYPETLSIQDDEINSEDVLTLIRSAKALGITALALTVPNPDIIVTRCRDCLDKHFWDVHLPHIRSCRVVTDDDGSVEIIL
ncbi:hypothetical protein FA13DRAFT_1788146 [Coprinellus micaceus]|uniref:Uncharacterized protein n=1 Tax=Coprinellus micaceus TaxID=71717 RepID=A0A4Y7TNI8_COPMI|nr:hypothetical protein FA13DRAFT_1788146 [Coprinellus micaceus]